MADLPNAARVGDPIEHTKALMGALTGLAVGVVVGGLVASSMVAAGAALVATAALAGPILILGAIAVGCTFTTAGFDIGKWLFQDNKSRSGTIGEGAASVFIGEGFPPAARALDPLDCGDSAGTVAAWGGAGAAVLGTAALLFGGPIVLLAAAGLGLGLGFGLATRKHEGAQIAEGSRTVLIERRLAARVGDQTSCSGAIADGCKTVFIGGPRVEVIPKKEWTPEVPVALEGTMHVVDFVGLIAGLIAIDSAGVALLAVIDVGLYGKEWYHRLRGDEAETEKWEKIRTTYEVVISAFSARSLIRRGLGAKAARDAAKAAPPAPPTLAPPASPTPPALPAPLPRTPTPTLPAGPAVPGRPIPNPFETPQLPALPRPRELPALPRPRELPALPKPRELPALPKPRELLALPKPSEMLALPPGNPVP